MSASRPDNSSQPRRSAQPLAGLVKKSPRIGLLLAPLAAPLAFVVLVLLRGEDPIQKDSSWISESATAWVFILGTVTLSSYLATVFLGVPLIYVLRRLDALSFWSIMLAAGFLGAAALVAAIFITGGYIVGPIWTPIATLAGSGALIGMTVAALYCWLSGSA